MSRYIVAITGASGVVYGYRLVEFLLAQGHELHLVVTDAGLLVMGHEMGLVEDRERGLQAWWPDSGERLKVYRNSEIGAVVASGSFKTEVMFIAPCTMATLAAVAGGLADNLVHRAADVMIKENRPLILVPRETPFSAIHLENMLKLARLGVRIVPAMPAFYHRPEGISELVDYVVGKILDAGGENPSFSPAIPVYNREAKILGIRDEGGWGRDMPVGILDSGLGIPEIGLFKES